MSALSWSGGFSWSKPDVEKINSKVRNKLASGALIKIAFIGDSVMRNASVYEVNVLPNYGRAGNLFPGALCGATGQMYQVKSGQTPGQNLYQIYTTQMDTVLDYGDCKPDIIFFAPSLNDIDTSPGDGVDYTVWGDSATKRATVRSWIEGVYDRAHAKGIAVISMDGWPSNSLPSDSNFRTNTQALYDIMADVARKKGALAHVSILGCGKFSNPDGSWRTGYNPSGDGVHLTNFDARNIAVEVFNQLSQQLTMKPYYPLPLVDDGAGDALYAAQLANSTPGVASGWTQNDAALTWTSRVDDIYGTDYWNAITATADSETIIYKNSVACTAGDRILICIDTRSNTSLSTNANVPYIWFRNNGSSQESQIMFAWGDDAFGATGRGWLYRHVFTAQEASMNLWAYIKGGAFTSNFQWRFKAINLTKIGIDPYSD